MLEPFVESMVRSLAPQVRRWIAPPALAQRLGLDLESSWAERSDPGFCSMLAQKVGLGRPDEEYRLRPIDLGRFGEVIVGIHFLGLDPQKPFVQVYGQTQDLVGSGGQPGIQTAVDRIADEMASFAPKSVRLFVPGSESLDGFPAGTRHDMRVVVGHLTELRSLPRPARFSDIELRPMSEGGYARYLEACEQLFDGDPAAREMLEIEPEDGLSQCQACYEAWIAEPGASQPTWGGLIAARHDATLGMVGYCMIEEILAGAFRGKRLAAAFQRHLIDRLEPHGDGLLWGTIDARNIPSRKTAARVGRLDIGGWVFVPSSRREP